MCVNVRLCHCAPDCVFGTGSMLYAGYNPLATPFYRGGTLHVQFCVHDVFRASSGRPLLRCLHLFSFSCLSLLLALHCFPNFNHNRLLMCAFHSVCNMAVKTCIQSHNAVSGRCKPANPPSPKAEHGSAPESQLTAKFSERQ